MNRHRYDNASGKIVVSLNAEHEAWRTQEDARAAAQRAAQEIERRRIRDAKRLTVADLISLLSELPMEAPVVVDGLGDVIGMRVDTVDVATDGAVLLVRE